MLTTSLKLAELLQRKGKCFESELIFSTEHEKPKPRKGIKLKSTIGPALNANEAVDALMACHGGFNLDGGLLRFYHTKNIGKFSDPHWYKYEVPVKIFGLEFMESLEKVIAYILENEK